jgi:hypothetical protein
LMPTTRLLFALITATFAESRASATVPLASS